MNTVFNHANENVVAAPQGMTELVRGTDQRLVGLLAPMVRERSIALDLGAIERIDAAGIAALISLYGCARDSGHTFNVFNVRTRVEEILGLVGLDHILVSHDAVRTGACFARSAA